MYELRTRQERIGDYVVSVGPYGFPRFDAMVPKLTFTRSEAARRIRSTEKYVRPSDPKRSKRQRAWDLMVERLRALHPRR